VRWLVVALALAGGCQETLAPPDFSEQLPQCPSSPMPGGSCDAISEPSCTYPTEQMVCTCDTTNVFVCVPPPDLGRHD
jgi:hypothetical protein